MPIRMETFFCLAFLCHGAGLVLAVRRWLKASKLLAVLALVAVTAALFLIADTHGQFPVLHPF